MLVSFFENLIKEFINLSQEILCKVEKKLCKALKNVLESRETSRKFLNTFSVKHNIKDITDPELLQTYSNLNSSYKFIIHNMSNGSRHPLLFDLVDKKESNNKVEVNKRLKKRRV